MKSTITIIVGLAVLAVATRLLIDLDREGVDNPLIAGQAYTALFITLVGIAIAALGIVGLFV